jgi:hypothetical protein
VVWRKLTLLVSGQFLISFEHLRMAVSFSLPQFLLSLHGALILSATQPGKEETVSQYEKPPFRDAPSGYSAPSESTGWAVPRAFGRVLERRVYRDQWAFWTRGWWWSWWLNLPIWADSRLNLASKREINLGSEYLNLFGVRGAACFISWNSSTA